MFKGSIVALITPFNERNEVDEKALIDLVKWQVRENTDGIVCCGTTGESPTLNCEEKIRIYDICVKAATGKCKIIAGTGTNNTQESVYLTKKAKNVGVDGCLVVVPYYNRPMPLGCIAHYNEIAKVGLPIIVYHHPKRTGTSLSIKVFNVLANIKNIVNIKESSCDLSFVKELIKQCSLPVLAGEDSLTASIMELGGVGTISVISNVIPDVWKKMIDLCLKRDFIAAFKIMTEQKPLLEALAKETNPQGIKYCLSLLDKCKPVWRLPLIAPAQATKKEIEKSFNMCSGVFVH